MQAMLPYDFPLFSDLLQHTNNGVIIFPNVSTNVRNVYISLIVDWIIAG